MARRAEQDDRWNEMLALGQNVRGAARLVAQAASAQKNKALKAMAQTLRAQQKDILQANEHDLKAAQNKLTAAKMDRLKLDDARISSMAQGLEDIAALDDPVGQVSASWERPNGLKIERCRTPLGVIGVIFESRPNVTADAGGLCLKAGNACLLRPGSESALTSTMIHKCLQQGLREADLPAAAITLAPLGDRAVVGDMLSGLNGAIDVLVPRGGRSLTERVLTDARVPVFAHLEGICHIYIDGEADLQKACEITLNAKMRRTGICGAAETVLIDQAAVDHILSPLVAKLLDAGCEVRGDQTAQQANPQVKPASEEDWSTEYLEAIISIKSVDGVRGAMEHIARYGSDHTEAIITENDKTAQLFLSKVDSAIVMHNASTQFADGGEFGMGAEIGIATGRFHARGPIGVEQLTSFKYIVRGDGQTRP